MWLVVTYLLHTCGELALSPVGLSAMSKLAPVRIGGLIMGVWFLALSVGNYIGGRLAALLRDDAAADSCSAPSQRSASARASSCCSCRTPVTQLEGAARGSRDGPREVPREARLHEVARAVRRQAPQVARAGRRRASSACRSTSPATCTTTSASSTTACCCRGPSPRVRRSIPATKRLAMHGRGSPDRVRRVRRRHPVRLRRRHRHAVGRRHLDPGSRRRRCGAEEGRPEVHARRLQAERLVGARADQGQMGRRRRPVVAADQAPRRLGGRRGHRRVRAAEREEQGRLRRHPRRGQPGHLALAIVPPRAARPARCSRRSSRARWRCGERNGFGEVDGFNGFNGFSGKGSKRFGGRRRAPKTQGGCEARASRAKATKRTAAKTRLRSGRRRRRGRERALEQAFAEHAPDGKRQAAAIVARDLGAPEPPEHDLGPAGSASPTSSGSLCSAA